MSTKIFDTNLMTLYGVWQDGLNVVTYEPFPGDCFLGSHVGNSPFILRANDSDPTYDNWTYNLSHCDSQTYSYIFTYGATYGATYYQELFCNVRALEWV